MPKMHDPLSLYPEDDAPLSLYQVLIAEYRAQRGEQFAAKSETGADGSEKITPEERFKRRLRALKVSYGLADESGNPLDLEDEDRERIEKKINSEMIKEFYRWLHEDDSRARSALCLSGGGIRSATFGLGIVQGLAHYDLLQDFDYLSTVSGGGYLGGWLSAWIHRRGLAGVVTRLQNESKRRSPLQPEAEPVKHLRTYSNYMSPKLGFLSADTWTLVAIYARNLLLNWLVLVPLILSALMLPRIYTWAVTAAQKSGSRAWATRYGAWLFVAGVVCGIVAVAYIYLTRPSLDASLPARFRSQKYFLFICLLPFVLLSTLSTIAYAWYPVISLEQFPAWLSSRIEYDPDGTGLWKLFTAFGVVLQLGGFFLALAAKPVLGWLSEDEDESESWKPLRYLREFLAAVSGGALSGLLTWLVALAAFSHSSLRDGVPVFSHLQTAFYACFALPLFLLLVLVSVTIFVGLMSRLTTDADREWLARAGGWLLIVCFVWALVSAVVVFAPVLLTHRSLHAGAYAALTSTGFLSGFVTLVFGRSSRSPASGKEAQSTTTISSLANFGLTLAAAVFAVFILALLSLVTTWFLKLIILPPQTYLLQRLSQLLVGSTRSWHGENTLLSDPQGLIDLLYHTPGLLLFALLGALVVFGVVMARGININKFSLHAAYRDRLIRAYLGASRNGRDRRPNPFTGFDDQDNLQMQELRTQRFSADSINDLRALAAQLVAARGRKGDDSPAEFISRRLSHELLDRLAKCAGDAALNDPQSKTYDPTRASDIKAALAAELNRIIEDEDLYDEKAFEKLWTDSDEIGALAPDEDEDALGVEHLRANRRLMEIAFNEEQADGTERRPVFTRAEMCRPLHVINIALNLVGGEDLAWQNRKAESFTISPLHSGSYCVGYRDSRTYAMNSELQAITLGTAVAVSGAAVSPNMGYHSSPLVTFLLTLFNVRLGWWLGNPGRAGADTYNQSGPVLAFRPIISEALGLTNDRNKYVYISDGGHFENLGLYEMILRRCRLIVVSDGSEDHDYTFEGLGNAISKVRVDLGVPVNFDKIMIFRKDYEPKTGERPGYCALGRICYSCVDGGDSQKVDGYLLYVKATLTGNEPTDIYNYSRAHEAFPHESTGDQMYSEEQFESYRELGFHALDQIYAKFGTGKPATTATPTPPVVAGKPLDKFFENLRDPANLGEPPLCS